VDAQARSRWVARLARRPPALYGLLDTGLVPDAEIPELAVALANQPKLLLMDEPTAGMAAAERRGLMELLAEIVGDQNIGVLFTEHDMDVVFNHADRILVMNRGQLIAQGTPQQVRENQKVQEVYLGTASTA
jgi:branched-chain amino acid transport system ATP-binding protein